MHPSSDLVYLNHAATSYPKPAAVLQEIDLCLGAPPEDRREGGRPDDSLAPCRAAIARLVGGSPERVILTPGGTHALNAALRGLVLGRQRGRRAPVHCLTTDLEHNSVLRPLQHLAAEGSVELEYLALEETRRPAWAPRRMRSDTLLLAITACSNVTGETPDLEAWGRVCAGAGVVLVVDAAQAAGSIELRLDRLPPRSLVALSGHKGLLGPAGTGALCLGHGVRDEELPAVWAGGTATQADLEWMPTELPLRLEPGTMNRPGFAGLSAGVSHVLARGVRTIARQKERLCASIEHVLAGVPGALILEPERINRAAGMVSFTIDGWNPDALVEVLQESYGIVTRGGLQCAPRLHHALGLPDGSVRVSVGLTTTEADVARLGEALREVSRRAA